MPKDGIHCLIGPFRLAIRLGMKRSSVVIPNVNDSAHIPPENTGETGVPITMNGTWKSVVAKHMLDKKFSSPFSCLSFP